MAGKSGLSGSDKNLVDKIWFHLLHMLNVTFRLKNGYVYLYVDSDKWLDSRSTLFTSLKRAPSQSLVEPNRAQSNAPS